MLVRKCLVPIALMVWFTATPTAQANFKLHPLFTDNAVLQQGQVIPVWGTCDDDEKKDIGATEFFSVGIARCQRQDRSRQTRSWSTS